MPRCGFKTITVTETVFDKFYQTWLTCKDELAMKGVSSFAGYITHLILECMKVDETFTKYQPRYEKIAIEECRIILRDNKINRIVELKRKGVLLHCELCEKDNCVHVGFCYSFHQIYGDSDLK